MLTSHKPWTGFARRRKGSLSLQGRVDRDESFPEGLSGEMEMRSGAPFVAETTLSAFLFLVFKSDKKGGAKDDDG